VEILFHDESVRESAIPTLEAHGVDLARCGTHIVPTDRVWLRDSGPTGVIGDSGFEWIRWRFNGWAKYDDHLRDEEVSRTVTSLTALPSTVAVRPDGQPLVMEGGGIDTNGAGALLVTEEWLLTDVQVRNPGMTRADYEAAFAEYLGIDHTI